MLIYTFLTLIMPILVAIFMLTNGGNIYKKIVLSVGWLLLLFLISFGINYFLLPNRTFGTIIVFNLVYSLITGSLLYFVGDEFLDDKNSYGVVLSAIIGVIGVILLAIYICLSLRTIPTYSTIQFENKDIQEAPTFKKDKTPVALSPKTVKNLVNKAISDVPNSTYYQIASYKTFQAQYIKGKPYYIIPLEFKDFSSYMYSDKIIPGYFKIDATSINAKPEFVKTNINYAPSAYFNNDAERKIRLKVYDWITSDSEPMMEIDENGTPYFVETLYKTLPFSNNPDYSRMGVVTLNAKTGSVKSYSLENAPKFLDECITTDVANNINESFGSGNQPVFGFKNKKNLKEPTGNGVEDGVTSLFNEKGTITYFADFTNVNKNNDSLVGFSSIDARSGKLTFYNSKGLMDSNGAISNANENYKANKWKAAMPILYNISGRQVWTMQILDSTNAIRGYYYLDASNQSVYGYGKNVNQALNEFNQALVNSNSAPKNTNGIEQKEVTGTVDRMAIVDNKTMIMVDNNIYTINNSDYQDAPLIKIGDKIKLKANIIDGKPQGYVKKFENITIKE